MIKFLIITFVLLAVIEQIFCASIYQENRDINFVKYPNNEKLFDMDVDTTIYIAALKAIVSPKLKVPYEKFYLLDRGDVIMFDLFRLNDYDIENTIKVKFAPKREFNQIKNSTETI